MANKAHESTINSTDSNVCASALTFLCTAGTETFVKPYAADAVRPRWDPPNHFESLEALFVLHGTAIAKLFGGLNFVVVDELFRDETDRSASQTALTVVANWPQR